MPKNLEKAKKLKALHEARETFIIANPWDAGSAHILAEAGFAALATTGAGLAYSKAKPNASPGREAILDNAAEIANAVDVPVSVDLENGFGDDVETVVSTIDRAIELGLAGGSIEDATFNPDSPILDIGIATERIAAAADFIRASGIPFQLVARAENYLYGREDLSDTIMRLQRFQEAGANVLYAPGLTHEDDIRTVVSSVDLPVNIVMGRVGSGMSFSKLAELGVTRVSVGSALQRLTFGTLEKAAHDMLDNGSFAFAEQALTVEELDERFSGR